MQFVYLVRLKSDGSICSIWTTKELAEAAVIYYDARYGQDKVNYQEWQVNVTLPQYR